MEQYVLYLVLKDISKLINNKFTYSFNDMDSNAPNVVGIYIKGGQTSNYRNINTGEYYNVNNRVQFLIQGDVSVDSLMNCLQLSSEIRNTLVKACNTEYVAPLNKIGYDETDKIVLKTNSINQVLMEIKLLLTKVDLLGEPVYVGKTEQGKPSYSINFNINYNIRR